MKIKWTAKVELTVVESIDENENVDDYLIDTTIGKIDEVDIIDDWDTYVDMQFGNGSMVYGVFKNWFEVIE